MEAAHGASAETNPLSVFGREPEAALLIDWENFYLGREAYCEEHGFEFSIERDLATLSESVSQKLEAELGRTIVRRAYADFNARDYSRPHANGPYYLQRTPDVLMNCGIEPIQVFSFPGRRYKNAADIRMAVDALRLAADDLRTFIFVTGDADFIPLAIDLRRLRARVHVVGVTGSTKPLLAKYCDGLHHFEDFATDVPAATAPDESREVGEVVEEYAEILKQSMPRIFMVSGEAWKAGTRAAVRFAGEAGDEGFSLEE
ncbi:MAG: NYN domain-containing protein, partial [Planctomycetota bacterium]